MFTLIMNTMNEVESTSCREETTCNLSEYGNIYYMLYDPTLEQKLFNKGYRLSVEQDFKSTDAEKTQFGIDIKYCLEKNKMDALKIKKKIGRIIYLCGWCYDCESELPFEYEINSIYVNDNTGGVYVVGDKCLWKDKLSNNSHYDNVEGHIDGTNEDDNNKGYIKWSNDEDDEDDNKGHIDGSIMLHEVRNYWS